MEYQDLIKALRETSINACGCRCGNVMDEALRHLERLDKQVTDLKRVASAEKKASFRLGQLSMREDAAEVLRETGETTSGNTRAALLIAADVIKDLRVID